MSSSRQPRSRANTASTRPPSAPSASASHPKPDILGSKPPTSAASRTLKQSHATRPQVTKATTLQPSQSRSRLETSTRVRATTTLKGTLPGATSSTSSSVAFDPAKTRPRVPEATSGSEQGDALQTAAQSCAWTYMTSTLEDELGKASKAAQIALEARKEELDAEEADIAESRVRVESERLLDFYDELDGKKVVEDVAAMVIRFRTLERNVGEVTSAALRLSSLPLDDTTHISRYNRMLDSIDSLEDDCKRFEVQLSSLSSAVSPSAGRLPDLISNISTLLSGHVENVACARSVVECCKENYRMGVGTLTLN